MSVCLIIALYHLFVILKIARRVFLYYSTMTPTQAQLGEGKRAVLETVKKAAEEAKEADKAEAIITSAEILSINPHHSESAGSPKKRKVEEESLDEPAASPKKKNKADVGDLLESWEDEEDESAVSGISSDDEDPPATPQQRKHTSSFSTPSSSAPSTPLSHEIHDNPYGYKGNDAPDPAAQGSNEKRPRPLASVTSGRGMTSTQMGEFKYLKAMTPAQRAQHEAKKSDQEKKRRDKEEQKRQRKEKLEQEEKAKRAMWEE
ncbi:hypothetical protein BDZ45DRAFT_346350 [Acephala macrosclerotiorum]|nr:hypothetical protein BDZ45DRAFT_346350 [Acephala macrosclerotiorum]